MRSLMQKCFRASNTIGLVSLIASLVVVGQQSQKPLTNQDVIELVKGGLGESNIVLVISRSATAFDTSPSALLELKKAGVPEAVIQAMLDHPKTIDSATRTGPVAQKIPKDKQQLKSELKTIRRVYITGFRQDQVKWAYEHFPFGHGSCLKPVATPAEADAILRLDPGMEAPESKPYDPVWVSCSSRAASTSCIDSAGYEANTSCSIARNGEVSCSSYYGPSMSAAVLDLMAAYSRHQFVRWSLYTPEGKTRFLTGVDANFLTSHTWAYELSKKIGCVHQKCPVTHFKPCDTRWYDPSQLGPDGKLLKAPIAGEEARTQTTESLDQGIQNAQVHATENPTSRQTRWTIPKLGITVGNHEAGGAVILELLHEGVAERDGLNVGDVVDAVNGKPVKTAPELADELSNKASGEKIRLGYMIRTSALGYIQKESIVTLQ